MSNEQYEKWRKEQKWFEVWGITMVILMLVCFGYSASLVWFR